MSMITWLCSHVGYDGVYDDGDYGHGHDGRDYDDDDDDNDDHDDDNDDDDDGYRGGLVLGSLEVKRDGNGVPAT